MALETEAEDEIEIELPEGETEDEVEIDLDEAAPGVGVEQNPQFWANLADGVIDDTELSAIARRLIDLTDLDKEAHKKRADAYAEALRRTGLDGNPTGGAEFEGASKAVSPMMVEAAVDFASMAIRELCPVGGQDGGPAKHHIVGKATQAKLDRAVRKSRLMNWQLTEQVEDFRDTLEAMLTQVAFSGRQYVKGLQDRARGRPDFMFVPMHDVWLPQSAATLAGARRYTHAQTVDKYTMDERIASGMYREVTLTEASAPDTSNAQEAVDSVAGRDRQTENEDGERLLREVYVQLELDGDPLSGGKLAPYIVTIDDETETVLAIYRDWRPDDPNREALIHLVEFPFIPWADGPIGLPQLIGGLSIAATGALRALLDSAHINNLQGAVKLKGGSSGAQSIPINPGQITEIEGGIGVDDIRKTIMALPFNAPSPVLFQLLGFLTDSGKGVVNVALEKLAESKADMPVGTTLALIEQGAKVYASIHARLHRAMKRVLKMLHQLNEMWLDEEMLLREAGEVLAKREDFEGAFDVIPVSDPNIFTEMQRFAQIQAVAARATGNPLYDQRKVEQMILERLKIPDAKDLLVPAPEPKRLNPVNENIAASMGQPLIAFPDQDHVAHLRTHIEYLLSPMFGMNPVLQPIVVPALLPHIKDHMVYAYAAAVEQAASQAAGVKVVELMDDDDEVSNHMDNLLAQASSVFLEDAGELFDKVMPPPPPPEPPPMPGQAPQPQAGSEMLTMLMELSKMVQALQPPMPMDPSAVQAQKVQVDQKKVDNDANARAAEQALEARKVAVQEQEAAAQTQQAEVAGQREERLQLRADETKREIAVNNNETKIYTNTQDNQTAMTIAAAEIESGESVALSTGTGINPGSE